MATLVQMPKLGESVVEGTVTRWLKAPGDLVAKLEPLLEISTDKIDTEIPAPADGILLDIAVPEGETVQIGSVLGRIGMQAEAVKETNTASSHLPIFPSSLPSQKVAAAQLEDRERPAGRAFISPVVGKLAKEYNLDLNQLSGSGMGGRITKKDVLTFVETQQTTEQMAPTPVETQGTEFFHPLTTLRRAIAQHMVQSKQTSPHVTTIFEVDMTAVVLHREANRQGLAAKGINLTFTPYFVAAAIQGLRTVPFANGRYSEQGIFVNQRFHIGVAVALEQNGESGLIVPVIRDADEKSLAGLARSVNELAQRARSGKLTPDDLSGGTFTVTNHGVGGSLVGTPIINQPQAAILGIGAIVKRPVVRNGNGSLLPSADDAIVIRPMCYLSLSFDHRILDGASADRFLTRVKETLENWKDE
ncbi:MAG: dihydrolipoamide acetyltransferase family protein [Caldilineaceae bacterium]